MQRRHLTISLCPGMFSGPWKRFLGTWWRCFTIVVSFHEIMQSKGTFLSQFQRFVTEISIHLNELTFFEITQQCLYVTIIIHSNRYVLRSPFPYYLFFVFWKCSQNFYYERVTNHIKILILKFEAQDAIIYYLVFLKIRSKKTLSSSYNAISTASGASFP